MLAGLLVLRALNRYPVQHLQFLEQVESIEAVAFLLGDGVAGEVEDDEFVEAGEALDLVGVADLVVADVQFHQTAQFRELRERFNAVILKRKLKQVIQCRDSFDLGDFVLAQLHLLQIHQTLQPLDATDIVLLKVQLLQQLALVDEANL